MKRRSLRRAWNKHDHREKYILFVSTCKDTLLSTNKIQRLIYHEVSWSIDPEKTQWGKIKLNIFINVLSCVGGSFSSNSDFLRERGYVLNDVVDQFKKAGSVKPYIKTPYSYNRFSMFVVCTSSARCFSRDSGERVVFCRMPSQRRFFERTLQVVKRILHGVCTSPLCRPVSLFFK